MTGSSNVSEHQLVFVGGLHRSGTTALARALGRHDAVSAFANTGVKEDEGQHLQDVYPSARAYGGAGRFAFDPAAHLTEASPLVSRANADRLLAQWSRHWDRSAPVWVEKSPPNLIMTRFLQALYPSARFVMIIRHPVVVTLSTNRWRRTTRRARLIEHWLRAYELFAADASGNDQVLLVRYEDLVADPASVLARVGGFLRLDGPVPADSIEASRSDVYAERWREIRGSRWPWHGAAAERLIRTYADRVAAFGYDLRDLSMVGDVVRARSHDG